MRRRMAVSTAFSVLIAASPAARADDAVAKDPSRSSVLRQAAPTSVVSLTLFPSLPNLVVGRPYAELTGELRITRRSGLALSTGFGSRSRLISNPHDAQTTLAWNLEANGRYYVVGDFERGMFVGWGVTYAHVASAPVVVDELGAVPPGLATGPVLGAKYIFTSGFTVDAGGGLALIVTTRDETIAPPFASPYFHLGVGWSF
jgi:hypothetical protein